MTKILKHKWIHSDIKIISGKNVLYGVLQILVDEFPEFEYRQIGSYFYAEKDEFVGIYYYNPRSKNGFGGRPITLRMEDGSKKTFYGTLWASMYIDDDRVPDYKPCSVTDDPETFKRGFTFVSYEIKPELFKQLIQEL
jgi:hypothetical protein